MVGYLVHGTHRPPYAPAPPRRAGGPASVIQGSFIGQAPAAQRPPSLASLPASGPGQALPVQVREQMEMAFGADFSDVRVHVGPQATAIGALAYTQGNHLFFAPGQYNPLTHHGQKLLGHELAHVLQQRSGRVPHPTGAGVAVVQDPRLEAEADRLGLQAATRLLQPAAAQPYMAGQGMRGWQRSVHGHMVQKKDDNGEDQLQFRYPDGSSFGVNKDWGVRELQAGWVRSKQRAYRHYTFEPPNHVGKDNKVDILPLGAFQKPKRIDTRIPLLDRDKLRSVMTAMIDGTAMPPISAGNLNGGASRVDDGFHRYHASVIFGLPEIPTMH